MLRRFSKVRFGLFALTLVALATGCFLAEEDTPEPFLEYDGAVSGEQACGPAFPLTVPSYDVEVETGREIVIDVDLANRADQAVDSFIVEFRFFDDRGELLESDALFSSETSVRYISQKDIGPGSTERRRLETSRYPLATSAELRLEDVQYQDGTRAVCQTRCRHQCVFTIDFE